MIKTFLMSCLLTLSSSLMAQPTIEIVVPVAPGGAVDMSARGLSQALVRAGYENNLVYKPGGNNEIARHYTVEKRDNVITVGSSATFVFSNLSLKRENQHVKDFLLYGPSLTNSMAFYVPASSSTKSMSDLVRQAKQPNVPLICGVSNNHGEMLLLLINSTYGTNFKPLMYKGTGQMLPDLLGGHIPCAFDQTAPYVKVDDRVKWLAVSGRTLKSGVPQISDVLPGFRFDNWYAAAVPKNSNLIRDARLTEILATWSRDPELVKPLLEQDFVLGRQENLNERAEQETKRFSSLRLQ